MGLCHLPYNYKIYHNPHTTLLDSIVENVDEKHVIDLRAEGGVMHGRKYTYPFSKILLLLFHGFLGTGTNDGLFLSH